MTSEVAVDGIANGLTNLGLQQALDIRLPPELVSEIIEWIYLGYLEEDALARSDRCRSLVEGECPSQSARSVS